MNIFKQHYHQAQEDFKTFENGMHELVFRSTGGASSADISMYLKQLQAKYAQWVDWVAKWEKERGVWSCQKQDYFKVLEYALESNHPMLEKSGFKFEEGRRLVEEFHKKQSVRVEEIEKRLGIIEDQGAELHKKIQDLDQFQVSLLESVCTSKENWKVFFDQEKSVEGCFALKEWQQEWVWVCEYVHSWEMFVREQVASWQRTLVYRVLSQPYVGFLKSWAHQLKKETGFDHQEEKVKAMKECLGLAYLRKNEKEQQKWVVLKDCIQKKIEAEEEFKSLFPQAFENYQKVMEEKHQSIRRYRILQEEINYLRNQKNRLEDGGDPASLAVIQDLNALFKCLSPGDLNTLFSQICKHLDLDWDAINRHKAYFEEMKYEVAALDLRIKNYHLKWVRCLENIETVRHYLNRVGWMYYQDIQPSWTEHLWFDMYRGERAVIYLQSRECRESS